MRNDFSQTTSNLRNRQRGAASIFVVIFFALLTGVITVSFVTITNHDQQQALNNDLSQSAYDAAKAGISDATRAITYCQNDDPNPASCLAKLNDECRDVSEFSSQIGLEKDDETNAVQVGTGTDRTLNQSYTCAKVDLTPDTIALTLDDQQMRIIELKSPAAIGALRVRWFDNKNNDQSAAMTWPPDALANTSRLPNDPASWGGRTTPPLIRLQLIRPGGTIDDLTSNSATAFLYPAKTQTTALSTALIADTGRDTPKASEPYKIRCDDSTYAQGALACTAEMTVSVPANTGAYLVLMPIYNQTNVEIQALNGLGGTPVGMEGYPSIDVTGRTGDVFRRVRSTIDLKGQPGSHDLPGFDSAKTICKNFAVSATDHFPDAETQAACGTPD